MKREHMIRRYISISNEVRFRNSKKKFVNISIQGKIIQMSMSDNFKDTSYSREEFIKILNNNFCWREK